MSNGEWTPARGWAIALAKAGWKSAVAGIIAGGAGYLLMRFVMSVGGSVVYGAFVLGAMLGYALGWFVSRKLVEDCGLVGPVIAGPVLVVMLLAKLVACWAAWSILNVTGSGPWGFTAAVMVLSAIAAGKTFVIDS